MTKDQYLVMAKNALVQLGANSDETAITATDIIEKIRENSFNEDMSEASLRQYLSTFYADPGTGIYRKQLGNGYYYIEPEPVISVPDASAERMPEIQEKEKQLYPYIIDWLRSQGYGTLDTSNYNLGKWGTPDVTGIKISEIADIKSLEICAVEAKVATKKNGCNWQVDIFQAIAYNRFSNRTYYAVAGTTEDMAELQKNLHPYIDTYSIGVLFLRMESEKYSEFLNGRVVLSSEDVQPIEIFHPPFFQAQMQYQEIFLKSIRGITTMATIARTFIKFDERS